MIEYAILIVMVIFAIGFAWLWFIEQKKKRKRKGSASAKGDRAIARKLLIHAGRVGNVAGAHDQADRDAPANALEVCAPG